MVADANLSRRCYVSLTQHDGKIWLKVDRKGRLAKGAAYTLTGGTLEIAAGVRLKGGSLTLPDGNGGTRTETVGVFSAANCPYISGEGELRLQTGTVILVK